MATTYTLINSNVLSASAASVTFSSIPATFTDLVVKVSMRDTAALNFRNIQFRFNGSTSTYSQSEFAGNGSTTSSTRRLGATYLSSDNTVSAGTSTANTFNNAEIYIPNYTSSTLKPSSTFAVSENNASTAHIMAVANLYSTTAAITEITFIADGVHAIGSSFYLYGISNA